MVDLIDAVILTFDAQLGFVFPPSDVDGVEYPGGLYLSIAPNNAPLPLAVMSVVSVVPDYSTQNEYGEFPYTERANIQFDVYGEDHLYVLYAMELVDKAFNQTEIAFEYEGFVAGRRVGGVAIRKEDGVWRGTYEYRFWVQRVAG